VCNVGRGSARWPSGLRRCVQDLALIQGNSQFERAWVRIPLLSLLPVISFLNGAIAFLLFLTLSFLHNAMPLQSHPDVHVNSTGGTFEVVLHAD
jgi:hypothetical protein